MVLGSPSVTPIFSRGPLNSSLPVVLPRSSLKRSYFSTTGDLRSTHTCQRVWHARAVVGTRIPLRTRARVLTSVQAPPYTARASDPPGTCRAPFRVCVCVYVCVSASRMNNVWICETGSSSFANFHG